MEALLDHRVRNFFSPKMCQEITNTSSKEQKYIVTFWNLIITDSIWHCPSYSTNIYNLFKKSEFLFRFSLNALPILSIQFRAAIA